MRRAAALLAAALLLSGAAGCGGGGAEPGAPEGATLVLDFTPNAAHTGIYAAKAEGFYEDEGVDLKIQQPGESTDAPKLLAAGKTEFAIMDIHDLALAREKDIDLVGVLPIVQRPLASVIARGDGPIQSPRDLEGRTVGVTGLPSDEAIVDSEVSADGGDPAKVKRVTIGFNAVSSLAAGKVDAATGFWNAEGVALRQQGVPVRTFKVDEFGAPRYPELVLVAGFHTIADNRGLVEKVRDAIEQGYAFTEENPDQALDDLLAADPSLDRADQKAQLDALLPALEPHFFDAETMNAWARWEYENGLVPDPIGCGVATYFLEEDLSVLDEPLC